jgi:hypothetical protein
VTAIWNTNAFFAYLITVKVFRLKWEPLRLVAVSIATLGVVTVVYGGSTSRPSNKSLFDISSVDQPSTLTRPRAPLVGDLLTLFASVSYGLYQVMYKKYVALPSDPEVASERPYAQIPASEEPALHESDGDVQNMLYPPPFGLHANFLTSSIGLCTLVILWTPIPILHYFGIEPFALPSNGTTVLSIAGIALGGVVFNASFMVSKFRDHCHVCLRLARFSSGYGVRSSPLSGTCSLSYLSFLRMFSLVVVRRSRYGGWLALVSLSPLSVSWYMTCSTNECAFSSHIIQCSGGIDNIFFIRFLIRDTTLRPQEATVLAQSNEHGSEQSIDE